MRWTFRKLRAGVKQKPQCQRLHKCSAELRLVAQMFLQKQGDFGSCSNHFVGHLCETGADRFPSSDMCLCFFYLIQFLARQLHVICWSVFLLEIKPGVERLLTVLVKQVFWPTHIDLERISCALKLSCAPYTLFSRTIKTTGGDRWSESSGYNASWLQAIDTPSRHQHSLMPVSVTSQRH